MVFQMKSYAVFTVAVLLSSVSVAHADNSNVFNSAVNARDAETKALAAFNDVDSTDGSGRFDANGNFSQKTEDNETAASQAALANPANGSTYRDQVTAQQENQKVADAYNKNASDYKRGTVNASNLKAMTEQDHANAIAANTAYGQQQAPVSKSASMAAAQAAGIAAGQAASPASTGNPNPVNATSYREGITQKQMKQVGIPTPVDTVPSTVTNIPGKVVRAPFVTVRGGNNEHTSNSHNDHGTGNGSNNAANSNSAHGLGGGDHIGGGRSGGGYHY